jgi:beta-N-acetylhexosaminidase
MLGGSRGILAGWAAGLHNFGRVRHHRHVMRLDDVSRLPARPASDPASQARVPKAPARVPKAPARVLAALTPVVAMLVACSPSGDSGSAGSPTSLSAAASPTGASSLNDPSLGDPSGSGGTGTTPGAGGTAVASTTGPSGANAAGSAAVSAAVTASPARSCAKTLLAGLSLKQRVGQLFVAGVPANVSFKEQTKSLDAASRSAVGSYLVYGGTSAGVKAVRRMTSRVSAALAARSDGLPPFVTADQEGGRVQPLRGPGFSTIPSALEQGRLPSSTLTRRWRTNWARDLVAAGVNVNFAPVADVVPASLGTANKPIGYYQREYGHTPARVSRQVPAALAGMQTAGVLATAKHFPGLGRVRGNTDTTAGVKDRVTTARSGYLEPFQAAVDAGVTFVMVSSAIYTKIDASQPAVFSPKVMGLLREQLGFQGVIVSDDLGAAEQLAAFEPRERALRFLAAGGQLIIDVKPPSAIRQLPNAVRAAAAENPKVRRRVDAAALAILTVKVRAGVIPASRCR